MRDRGLEHANPHRRHHPLHRRHRCIGLSRAGGTIDACNFRIGSGAAVADFYREAGARWAPRWNCWNVSLSIGSFVLSRRSRRGAGAACAGATTMTFDPEEMVTCPGLGMVTLRKAVTWVMERATQHPGGYAAATIFRDGQPSILDLADIRKLASEWEITS